MEFRSFSKTGGFTGVRCGFTVMTKRLLAQTSDGRELPLHRALASALEHKSEQRELSGAARRGSTLQPRRAGHRCAQLVDHYMGNARILSDAADRAGLQVYGGRTRRISGCGRRTGLTSWQMFDRMLEDLNVVITPGSGFGAEGEGYFRISAFNSRANAEEVARRLEAAVFSNPPAPLLLLILPPNEQEQD